MPSTMPPRVSRIRATNVIIETEQPVAARALEFFMTAYRRAQNYWGPSHDKNSKDRAQETIDSVNEMLREYTVLCMQNPDLAQAPCHLAQEIDARAEHRSAQQADEVQSTYERVRELPMFQALILLAHDQLMSRLQVSSDGQTAAAYVLNEAIGGLKRGTSIEDPMCCMRAVELINRALKCASPDDSCYSAERQGLAELQAPVAAGQPLQAFPVGVNQTLRAWMPVLGDKPGRMFAESIDQMCEPLYFRMLDLGLKPAEHRPTDIALTPWSLQLLRAAAANPRDNDRAVTRMLQGLQWAGEDITARSRYGLNAVDVASIAFVGFDSELMALITKMNLDGETARLRRALNAPGADADEAPTLEQDLI
jgi:hypothetical protein